MLRLLRTEVLHMVFSIKIVYRLKWSLKLTVYATAYDGNISYSDQLPKTSIVRSIETLSREFR